MGNVYYLFIHKPDDIAKYQANFERVKKSIQEGRTPVYSEVRSARTNLFESIPYNAMQGIFMILAALAVSKINVNEILKVAVVLVVNNVCGAISNFIFVHVKHILRVKLCSRLGIQATEENIAVMESLEYQSV